MDQIDFACRVTLKSHTFKIPDAPGRVMPQGQRYTEAEA
jgi:hypothetical protein